MDIRFYELSFQRYGMAATLYHAAYRAAQRLTDVAVWKTLVLTMETLDRQFLEDARRAGGRLLAAEELRPHTRIAETRLTDRFVDAAAARGDRCLAYFEGDRLISYGWYSTRPPVHLTELDTDLYLHFDPKYAYMHNGYTLPQYRGHRLHALGMAAGLEAHAEQGLHGLVSYVDSANFASRRSCYRMGYRDIGHVLIARVGQRFACHATRGCEPYGLRVAPLAS
jgi:hypothetical protein